MTSSSTLLTAQQTLTTESRTTPAPVLCEINSFGKTPVADKIWKRWRTAPIILSTCILTLAIFQVVSTSDGGN